MKASTGLLLIAAAVAAFVVFSKTTAGQQLLSGSTLPSNLNGATTQPVSSLGAASTQYIGSSPVSNFDSGGDPSSGDDFSNASMFDDGVFS
jgi:hypothetical protein